MVWCPFGSTAPACVPTSNCIRLTALLLLAKILHVRRINDLEAHLRRAFRSDSLMLCAFEICWTGPYPSFSPEKNYSSRTWSNIRWSADPAIEVMLLFSACSRLHR
jgi:hypothetical protein